MLEQKSSPDSRPESKFPSTWRHGLFRKVLLASSRLVGMGGLLLGASATVWAGEWSLVKGAQFDLCRALERGVVEHKIRQRYICETPLPTDDPDFSRPAWEDVDPIEHFELIKEIYFWARGRFEFRDSVNVSDLSGKPEKPVDQMDAAFSPLEAELRAVVQTENFHLQRSQFDIDHDGELEYVYRMTVVGRSRPTMEEFKITGREWDSIQTNNFGCETKDLAASHHYIFLRFEDHPESFFTTRSNAPFIQDPFFYRGRAYVTVTSDFYIHEPTHLRGPGTYVTGPVVCNFEFAE